MSNLTSMIKDIQRATGADVDGVFGSQTARRVLNALQGVTGMEITKPIAEAIPPGIEGELRPRTLEVIRTLDPKARDRFVQFYLLANATAATFGCEYIAISGYRTWAEQAELKRKSDAGGPHAAAPGYSWHNFAVATDSGVFQGNGKIYLDSGSPAQQALAEKVHYAVAVHAKACGLEHGGTWKGKSCDPPHFQIDMGHSSPTAADRAIFKERGSVL